MPRSTEPKLNVDLAITLSRFRQEYMANGCNATQAAISLGYAKKSAGSKGAWLKRMAFCGVPMVDGREIAAKVPFKQYLETVGVDDMRLAQKISEGMDAKDKIRGRTGEVIDADPNWSAQFNFTKLGLEAGGQLKEALSQVNVQVNFESLLGPAGERDQAVKVEQPKLTDGKLIKWEG